MDSTFQVLARSWRTGRDATVATVVETFSSAPRLPGAMMVVDDHGAVTGSISGGCVEASVYTAMVDLGEGEDIIAAQRYGVSTEDAFAVGLTCGGTIDVVVQKFNRSTHPDFDAVADAVDDDRAVALATIIEHSSSEMVGRTVVVGENWERCSDAIALKHPRLVAQIRSVLATGECATVPIRSTAESGAAFVWVHTPRPLMLVFGAVDFARALAVQGSQLGYRVVVCDARATFATAERFPAADEVVVEWPHKYVSRLHRLNRLDHRTVACVLTHDPKFDDDLLEVLLRLPMFAYVGAMGSRRTHDIRMMCLRDRGLQRQQLDRLRSPIGLDLGARTPDETAVSIAAEILANRYQRSARALSKTEGRIHAGTDAGWESAERAV